MRSIRSSLKTPSGTYFAASLDDEETRSGEKSQQINTSKRGADILLPNASRLNKKTTWSKAAAEKSIWYVNIVTCVLHFTSATVSIALWSDWPIPVTTSFISWEQKNATSEDGCGDGNCYVKSAFATWDGIDISILGLVVAFHALSFSWQFAVLWPTPIQEQYHANLALGINPFRWFEYAISAPLMIIVIAAILGQVDVIIYFLLAVCTSVLMGLGYLQEIHMRDTIVPHIMGWMLFFFTWAAPTFTFAVSLTQGAEQPPSSILVIIWATYFIMISLFGCFGIVQIVHVSYFYRFKPTGGFSCFRRRKASRLGEERTDASRAPFLAHYYTIEWTYGLLSATAKVTLAVLLIWLIRTRNEVVKLEFYDNYNATQIAT